MAEIALLPLFRSLEPETLAGILATCALRDVTKGEVVAEPGRPPQDFFLLLAGRLRVHLDTADRDPVAFIEQGEPVGEMDVIDHAAASAYVVADEDSRLLVMGEEALWTLVRSSHTAACTLLRILTRRLRQANEVIAGKMQLEQAYYHSGSIDTVTGLRNRSWLDTVLSRQLRRCTIGGQPFSLINIGIDRFREFNDRHGQLCGNQALRTVARVLMDHLRPTEIAARFGGDEFLVILPSADAKQARIAAERLRQKVMYTDIILDDGRRLPSLTVSLGVAEARPGQTVDGILAVAQSALQRAKVMGRNFVSD
jgi:diguanylate cyclase (GGDEF)-like protein